MDVNRFGDRPAFNPDVERLFGARNDRVPNGVYLSPRIGFSWTYGTAPQIGAFDGAARVPRAVVRGGIGVFQTLIRALTSQSRSNTGLPGRSNNSDVRRRRDADSGLARYAADPSAIPSECLDGRVGTLFATPGSNVTAVRAELRVAAKPSVDVCSGPARCSTTACRRRSPRPTSRNTNQPGSST